MYCKKCGRKVAGDKCPFCGTPVSSTEDESVRPVLDSSDSSTKSSDSRIDPNQTVYSDEIRPGKNKRGALVIVLAILLVAVAIVFVVSKISGSAINYFSERASRNPKPSNKIENTSPSTNTNSGTKDNTKNNSSNNNNTTSTPKTDPFVGTRTSFKGMKLGEIGKEGKLYVSLNYVKKMNYLPTALGKETVSSDKEVIIGFFEFYNDADKAVKADIDSITCYVDGVQVTDVNTYFKVVVDDIHQLYSTDLDEHCQLITCQDFEVPKGWKEIRFYYNSNCYWTISQEDVKTDNYKLEQAFSIDHTPRKTLDGKVIYSEPSGYTIVYKGAKIYKKSGSNYVIFKFEIQNAMNEALDTSLMGYKMKAYQNNYLLGDSDFILSDKIDGFVNIYDIDSIEAGMSSKIYVAFEVDDTSGAFYMIYDDGYISSKVRGYVYDVID